MAYSEGLPIALLTIYILLFIPTIYIAIKHGFRHAAILGWGYLLAFYTIRVVSSALELHDPASRSAGVVSSIGLSPLLLATGGILHESRAYLIRKGRKAYETAWVVQFHIVVTIALALVAVGAAHSSNPTSTADDIMRAMRLAKAGMVILLLSWLLLIVIASYTFMTMGRREPGLEKQQGGRTLFIAVVVAIPLIGIRLLASFVYFFTQNPLLNPITGSLGLRVGLEILEEILVSVLFVSAGLATRNIGI
ncbi:hypothetical protein F5X96DRAFT_645365 [Biscogniauxia mediterranea]|nr:hypothetical protein F5X96DRAFT_645365 [Biscogniauxia mediterranea]